jgi:hypothetical protein
MDDRAALALGQVWKLSPNSWTEFLMFKISFERPDFIKKRCIFFECIPRKISSIFFNNFFTLYYLIFKIMIYTRNVFSELNKTDKSI